MNHQPTSAFNHVRVAISANSKNMANCFFFSRQVSFCVNVRVCTCLCFLFAPQHDLVIFSIYDKSQHFNLPPQGRFEITSKMNIKKKRTNDIKTGPFLINTTKIAWDYVVINLLNQHLYRHT